MSSRDCAISLFYCVGVEEDDVRDFLDNKNADGCPVMTRIRDGGDGQCTKTGKERDKETDSLSQSVKDIINQIIETKTRAITKGKDKQP